MKTNQTTTLFKLISLLLLACLVHPVSAQWSKYSQANFPVCNSSYEQLKPDMVSDGAGGMIITWYDKRSNTDFDIYAQRLNKFGNPQWSTNGVPVCRISGDQTHPVVCSDGNGGAIIAWLDFRSGNTIYAQKLNASGVRQWDTSGISVCSSGGAKSNLKIVSDFAGGAMMVWDDVRNGFDIIGQRLNSTGILQWTSTGLEICVAADDQKNPDIVNDADSGLFICWQDIRAGKKAYFDIFAQSLTNTGVENWTSGGLAVCSAQDEQILPVIEEDDSGGVIICWQDKRAGTYDIYAQRLKADGKALWLTDGYSVSSASNNQTNPRIIKDGKSGVIMCWNDGRTNNATHIYAQKFNYTGAGQWTNNGVPVCTTSGNREAPQMVSNFSQGAIISWSDSRSGNYDLYAQQILSNGSALWTNHGIAISNAGNNQTDNCLLADGLGGAFLAWRDSRSNDDIYAQNILEEGGMGIVPEINIKGNGKSIADNDMNPETADNTDMGSIKTYSEIVKSFKIFNSGNDSLKIIRASIDGVNKTDFIIYNITLPKTIAPRDSTSFSVKFIPSFIGVENALVRIENNDSNEAIYEFAIRATLKAPRIEIAGNGKIISNKDITPSAADSTDFGNIRSIKKENRTYEIKSAGTDTLYITNISITGTNSSDFVFTPISYPRKLSAGKSLYLPIEFKPGSLGLKTAVVNVYSNDSNLLHYSFAIQARSVEPEITIKGNAIDILDGDNTPSLADHTDFGKVNLKSYVKKDFFIHNIGSDSLRIIDIKTSGGYSLNFMLLNMSFPFKLGPGKSYKFTVTYTPTLNGDQGSSLQVINDDDDESVYDFAIKGTGISTEIQVEGNRRVITHADNSPDMNDFTDFGKLAKNSSMKRNYYIKNVGTDTLFINSVTLSGADKQWFNISKQAASTILAGDSSNFEIEFKPLNNGMKLAEVTILNNDADESAYRFSIQGLSVSPVFELKGNQLAIAHGSLANLADGSDFDSIQTPNTVKRTFKIYNTGNEILTINAIEIAGMHATAFELATYTFPIGIAAGGDFEFEIEYKPSDEGIHQAMVKVMHNDLDQTSPFEFNIKGKASKEFVAITALQRGLNIQVFPNPSRGIVTVDLQEAEASSLKLYSKEGKLVFDARYEESQMTLDLRFLNAGVYLLQIEIRGVKQTSLITIN